MKSIFSIHAGEYLLGLELEKRLHKKPYNKPCNVWVPGKDYGIDLLVTDKKTNKKAAALQAKFSKDYAPMQGVLAGGWWTFDLKKMKDSPAEFWVLVLYALQQQKSHFIIIEPSVLLSKIRFLRSNRKSKVNFYLWINRHKECYATRDLPVEEQNIIANGKKGAYKKSKAYNPNRDFNSFYEDFKSIAKLL